MKSLVLFATLFSSQVFARQYIQCNSLDMNITDVMVVNLTTVNAGTLFISSGMQNPEDERTLVKIELSKVEDGGHIYNIMGDNSGFLVVPSHAMGRSINSMSVELNFNNSQVSFSCFARIYDDKK